MYHRIIIVGNLGRDPEMRFTPSGQQVTNFSVATNRTYTASSGETVKETIWFRVTTWGRLAETCSQYLRRGSRVLVEGRLVPDPSTGGPRVYTRQDGSTGASFEVTAQVVRFLSTRAEDQAALEEAPGTPEAREDEIPF
jgi:single-strand DNA-binding protein